MVKDSGVQQGVRVYFSYFYDVKTKLKTFQPFSFPKFVTVKIYVFVYVIYVQPSSGGAAEIYEEKKRGLAGLSLIVCNVILKGLANLDQERFALHVRPESSSSDSATPIGSIFPLLSALVMVESRDVRSMVRTILLTKVAPLLNNTSSDSTNSSS